MVYMVITAALIFGLVASQAAEAKKVIGWVEKVAILPEKVVLTAKIDTGADNSCLDVREYSFFDRDGERWVRFEIAEDGDKGEAVERKVERMAEIKRHKGKAQSRPVVKMVLCRGGVKREAEVNLTDRHRFKYRMLIGRSFLDGEFSVDPSIKLTVEPVCRGD